MAPTRKLVADVASWYCVVLLVALVLVASFREIRMVEAEMPLDQPGEVAGRLELLRRPCDEIYVVAEGETLHTISDKCGDPFIVEQNPHIQDPDDVFPGLVIKITPRRPRNL